MAKKVKVKIALVVDEYGDWWAVGDSKHVLMLDSCFNVLKPFAESSMSTSEKKNKLYKCYVVSADLALPEIKQVNKVYVEEVNTKEEVDVENVKKGETNE